MENRSTDVVVIGGGIAGCASAYYIAKRGVPVTVCEKGDVGLERSSRNWGVVRQQGRDAAESPLMMVCPKTTGWPCRTNSHRHVSAKYPSMRRR